MRAICYVQEVKNSDLTMRQQILICRKALRKLRWPCVQELFAQAGTEEQPLTLRPGVMDLLHAAANGEVDVLIVVDINHLHCGRPWKGCLHLCCSTVCTLSVSSAAGSSRVAGIGWLFQITILRCEVKWNTRKKMCFFSRVSGCIRARAANIALLPNSS